MATTSNSKVKLKLLIDKKNQKVLFAEANKDFVDFLFSLMSFPLGNVIRLLTKNNMVGCLGNLYESIETLSDTYLQPTQNKDSILKPKVPFPATQAPLLLPNSEFSSQKVYYCPRGCAWRVAFDQDVACPGCQSKMSSIAAVVATNHAKQVASNGDGTGFVKDVVTYMVMDNLEVKPMSTISGITLINTFSIRDLSCLEEKMVDIGVDEGLKLLQVALQAKNVLTSVFLKA
ncbi:uncharacterized protein LOC126662039 [Mercurialis annua]|uniref:uncharacterized protein LOC126661216 n=1 Tax=Mercurialis annua TaxID=3986 RepID=UPI002160A31E|nr:uncharacterized protein LOC126661216 [Mercurialis annua]XP_050211882.1 uncharacterized protein LOC126662039 [Mercurialis annua]